ncbi:zinc-binding dehydrogenase [Mycolicibacterium litorale]|uniref:alcohol dehydrogenase n=1 Tax=Mycolicibacterium litorale TaxID=758802 RepID=A0AAD1MUR1_9MYCO|nr:zinc-binding dehydrogenase [Mycolicibacterium litorale]MCV7416067.1 zinc-binding dehydrogenase [Mycolicibacterium litorale]TDY09319.1 putative phosphonate catabolism associated alcohol dehydrogenase [Mycolicibacterium litorale]BBY17263.1 alcohol dehydrogenase [Mycolicibacterium litorale]
MDPVAPRVSRAAVWTAHGVEIRDVDVPADDTLIVRVRLATVCGSDLHTVTGRRGGPCPSVLGHEAVGDVVRPDPRRGLAVGERVVWSVTATCGRCPRCRSGRSAKCAVVRKVGHEPFAGDWPLSGAYSQYIALPAGVAVQRVPDGLDDPVAAPAACATATVMATLEAAGPPAGRRVLICGAGMLGVTAAAACAEGGADVRVTDRDAERLRVAGRFGAAVDAGGPVDVLIDFTGATTAIEAALPRLDIGGVLVLAGSVMPGPALALDPESVVRRWWTIRGVHNYEPRHLAAAIAFLERTRDTYPWASVVSAPVGLDDIASVLTATAPGILRAGVAP